MFRYKTLSITAILTVFVLLSFVNHSNAASITSFSVYATYDSGSGGSVSANLSADEDILFIDWYVKQTFPKNEADSDYEFITTSMHNDTKSVNVSVGSFDGHIKIADYAIKAVVSFVDSSDEDAFSTFNVYKPEKDSTPYKKTGIYGYAELTAHYYDGSSIIMDGYVYAYNGIGGDARGSGKFKHTALNKQLDELEFPLRGKTFKLGETYAYSTGSFDLSFEAGTLSKVNIWKCEAYIRLRVGHGQIDEWFAGDTNTFDEDDLR